MKRQGLEHIRWFQKQWQSIIVAEVLLYALSLSFLSYVLSLSIVVTILIFCGVCIGLFLLKKPWQFSLQKTAQYIDGQLDHIENSTELFLKPEIELTNIARLQKIKVSRLLQTELAQLLPQRKMWNSILVLLVCLLVGGVLLQFQVFQKSDSTSDFPSDNEVIVFQALDSVSSKENPPQIHNQILHITYPAYTNLEPRTSLDMNLKALEGSQVAWKLKFDQDIDHVMWVDENSEKAMRLAKESYLFQTKLKNSHFYNFKFKALNGLSYLSDLYAIEVIKDELPAVEIINIKQFTTFEIGESKVLNFNVVMSDDFGIADAFIVATVTKGEGESVKFREERLAIDQGFEKGSRKLNLSKSLDLDALKMEAGDELYFYVESVDVKTPKANRARSETFFAVIRDTATNNFSVEGTMAADLMPDYFRSQRQLIIDTEKLIADKNRLSKEDFNATSNALGYDQKALRLKYGEFMGDEADSGIQVTQDIDLETPADDHDLLEEYTHDHDGSNEHNLVENHEHDHDHDDDTGTENKVDPLESYLHNHDDPEESTLFTESLRGKLKQAMAEMWDAELHLRLYAPEKSLPYQYRALKLIQEIKNSARIYVHRIGFDPPPIKEDKRLTGDFTEVTTIQNSDEVKEPDDFEYMRKSVARISEIIHRQASISQDDRDSFAAAGNELAVLAIESPVKYLHVLQELKLLSEKHQTSMETLKYVQFELLNALPKTPENPIKRETYQNKLSDLILKEITSND